MPHNFQKFHYLLLACLAVGIPDSAQAGSVQFSTYYPAPFGMYDRLRLVPRANLDAQLPCDPGTMYINADAGNQIEVCNTAGDAWAPLSGGPWTEDVNGVYVTDINANVGIGTITPVDRLTITAGWDPSDLVSLEDNTTTPRLVFGVSDAGDYGFITHTRGQEAAPDVVISAAGNVGIGTTTPASELHINSTDGITGLRLTDSAGSPVDWEIRADQALNDGLGFYTFTGAGGPKYTLILEEDGNVGIGTTTPNNRIQVQDLINFNNGTTMTALGYQTGISNTGNGGTFIGYQAGLANTTGANNTFVGQDSGRANTSGVNNTASGTQALSSNTGASNNTAIGRMALTSNIGSANTAVGSGALRSNTTGDANTAVGGWALAFNATGTYNTAIGQAALYSNTTANNNTANGYRALFANTTGNNNTANGYRALFANTTGNNNTATGGSALYANTTGIGNTASGGQALYSNTTGGSNTATGGSALFSNTFGNNNTATGGSALSANTIGIYNTATGFNALSSNTTGNNNIAVGINAGDNITTGSQNIIIGADIDAPSATGSNQLSIGNLIFGTGLDGTGTTVSTGNIGIGTTAPGAKLEVAGGAIKATGGLIIQTCTAAAADCPTALTAATGQIWLCTDC